MAAMLLSGAMFSCGGPEEGAEIIETEPAQTAEQVSGVGAEAEDAEASLPELDLGGYTVSFYSGRPVPGIYAEELTGETINDAVFNRNTALSEKYNFNINYTESDGSARITTVMNTVLAGDDAWQVLVDGGNFFNGFIVNGMLNDMNTLKYQDYSKPWWHENLNKGISLRNHLYMSVSPMLLLTYMSAYHPFVNADLAANLGVDVKDLYQDVRDGKWTVDRMIDLAGKGSADLNGDGVMDHTDQWGLQSAAFGGYTIGVGSGFQIARKDNNDEPYFSMISDESMTLWDKLCDRLFSDSGTYLATQNIKGVNIWDGQYAIFREGRALVFIGNLENQMREYEYNYAVLPMPKYDEQQELYYHTASCWNAPMMGVPVTAADTDKVSFILEAMSKASYEDVMPAFYRDYMERKLVRDEESIEMLNIIYNSIFFDCGSLYNWGALVEAAGELAVEGVNNLPAKFAAKESSAESEMKAMLDAVGN